MKHLLLIFLLTLTVNCFSQTVSISHKQTPSLLQLQVRYSGQPIAVTAISIKISYDTTVFRMDSVRMSPEMAAEWGVYYTTSSWVDSERFAFSWFSPNDYDTLYLKGVICNVWLHKKATGCSQFSFVDGLNNELTGLNYLPIPTDFVGTSICNNSIQSKAIVNGIEITTKNGKRYGRIKY